MVCAQRDDPAIHLHRCCAGGDAQMSPNQPKSREEWGKFTKVLPFPTPDSGMGVLPCRGWVCFAQFLSVILITQNEDSSPSLSRRNQTNQGLKPWFLVFLCFPCLYSQRWNVWVLEAGRRFQTPLPTPEGVNGWLRDQSAHTDRELQESDLVAAPLPLRTIIPKKTPSEGKMQLYGGKETKLESWLCTFTQVGCCIPQETPLAKSTCLGTGRGDARWANHRAGYSPTELPIVRLSCKGKNIDFYLIFFVFCCLKYQQRKPRAWSVMLYLEWKTAHPLHTKEI